MFYILVYMRVSDYLLPKNVTECRGCGSTSRLIGSKSDIRPFASVVLESTFCLTQYRIMVMTSTRIVMIMHSIAHTCPFGRDSMILWGEFLIILLAAPESCTDCTYAIAVRWRTAQGRKSTSVE